MAWKRVLSPSVDKSGHPYWNPVIINDDTNSGVDYEDLILQRQEDEEIAEDTCMSDNCRFCKYSGTVYCTLDCNWFLY